MKYEWKKCFVYLMNEKIKGKAIFISSSMSMYGQESNNTNMRKKQETDGVTAKLFNMEVTMTGCAW